jgi:hypothetical protein
MNVPAWCAAYRPAQAVQTRSLVVLDFRSAGLPDDWQQTDSEKARVASALARAYPAASSEPAGSPQALSQEPQQLAPANAQARPSSAGAGTSLPMARLGMLARAFPAVSERACGSPAPPQQRQLRRAVTAPSQPPPKAASYVTASAETVPTTVTLSSGHAMPLVGLGTWKSPRGAVARAVRTALHAGCWPSALFLLSCFSI